MPVISPPKAAQVLPPADTPMAAPAAPVVAPTAPPPLLTLSHVAFLRYVQLQATTFVHRKALLHTHPRLVLFRMFKLVEGWAVGTKYPIPVTEAQ